MIYEEFNEYQSFKDENHPFVNAYKDQDGNVFYIEPGFYDGLLGFKEKRFEDFDRIMNSIKETIKKNHKVIFTADFEYPWVRGEEGFIYREIHDITDPLEIYVEDKSRGSDYGD
ncbi:MAG: hypothetical protein ACI32C_00920 [Candidatus Enteromonas sp.]